MVRLEIEYPRSVALFLDLDGTLFDITAVPADVSVPAGLSATLGQLQRALGGAVAILTGRKIDEVDRLLAPARIAAAGVHGAELRLQPNGAIEITSASVPESLVRAVDRLASSIPGVLVEHKGIAVTVHYRAVPAMELVLEAVANAGFKAGGDVFLALDVASSELWENGRYVFKKSGEPARSTMRRPRSSLRKM